MDNPIDITHKINEITPILLLVFKITSILSIQNQAPKEFLKLEVLNIHCFFKTTGILQNRLPVLLKIDKEFYSLQFVFHYSIPSLKPKQCYSYNLANSPN